MADVLPPGSENSHRVTVSEVAVRAGVSTATASKALNGRGQLRAETRHRVLRAARDLRFVPAPSRGRPTGSRSLTIGLITADGSGRFSIPILLGAEDAFGAGQVSVLLCETRDDVIREHHHVQTLTMRRIDGIIVTGRRCDPRPPLADQPAVPVVYVMGASTSDADISVIPDNAAGARLGVEHLIATGRRHIAHVTGPAHHFAAHVRAEATGAALAAAGLELATGACQFGAWTEEWGRQAAVATLRAAPDCDAISCGSDQICRGVADGLRGLGVRVPDDVALVGFDNWEAIATACRPPLTTIDMDLRELGHYAAERLIEAMAGQAQPGPHRRPCQLVVRESSAYTTRPVDHPRGG